MLLVSLHNAGFFPIQWLPANSYLNPGTTYVRPSAAGLLRVFVPKVGNDIEVYTGSLFDAQLRYRGPINSEEELQQILTNPWFRAVAA
jgi:hypothetical protein